MASNIPPPYEPQPPPQPAPSDEPLPVSFPVVAESRVPVVQTPLMVGLAMLLVGIVIGYLSHPVVSGFIAPSPTPSPLPPTVTSAPSPEPARVQPTTESAPATDTSRATQMAQLMEVVVANTRHFKGSPDAPVTLVEFSDFQ